MQAVSRQVLVVLALLGAAAVDVSAGGWSVITLSDFPDFAVAGRPLTLTFTVRQHGNNLVGGLKPSIQASTPGAAAVIVRARPTSRAGEYAATLALDRLGDWSIVVDGGFNPDDRARRYNSIALPPLRVIPGGPAPLVLLSEAERGASLLVTKGCVTCHAPGSDRDVTRRHLAADPLRTFLADPAIRQIDMPNLDLKAAEISALTAYLTGARSSVLSSR